MNYRMIFYILGWVLNIEAAAMLLPLICAVIYGDGTVASLVYSILICLVIGVPLTFRAPEKKTMFAKEGFMITPACGAASARKRTAWQNSISALWSRN